MTRQERSQQFREAWKTLTVRERMMLSLRCQGRTNQEIAEEAFISRHTAKNHAYNAVNKLENVITKRGKGAATQLDVVCFRLGYERALLDVQQGTAELEEAA